MILTMMRRSDELVVEFIGVAHDDVFSNFLLFTSDDDKNALSSHKSSSNAHETVALVVVLLLLLLLRQERQQSGNGGYNIILYYHSRIHTSIFSRPFCQFLFFLCGLAVFFIRSKGQKNRRCSGLCVFHFLFLQALWMETRSPSFILFLNTS